MNGEIYYARKAPNGERSRLWTEMRFDGDKNQALFIDWMVMQMSYKAEKYDFRARGNFGSKGNAFIIKNASKFNDIKLSWLRKGEGGQYYRISFVKKKCGKITDRSSSGEE